MRLLMFFLVALWLGAPLPSASLKVKPRAPEPRYAITDLGTLGGERSEARAVNDAGQVVGSAETGKRDRQGRRVRHAYL